MALTMPAQAQDGWSDSLSRSQDGQVQTDEKETGSEKEKDEENVDEKNVDEEKTQSSLTEAQTEKGKEKDSTAAGVVAIAIAAVFACFIIGGAAYWFVSKRGKNGKARNNGGMWPAEEPLDPSIEGIDFIAIRRPCPGRKPKDNAGEGKDRQGKNDSKGRQQAGIEYEKKQFYSMKTMTNSESNEYIDMLFAEYYPEDNIALRQYLQNNKLSTDNFNDNGEALVTLKVLYCVSDMQEEGWKPFGQTAYLRPLPKPGKAKRGKAATQGEETTNGTQATTDGEQLSESQPQPALTLRQAIETLRQDLPEDKQDIQVRLMELLSNEEQQHKDKEDRLRNQLQKSQDEVLKIQGLFDAELTTSTNLQNQLENERKTFAERLKKDTEKVQKELYDTKEQLKANKNEAEKKLDKEKKRHEQEEKALTEKHQHEVKKLNDDHQKYLNSLVATHTATMEEKERTYNASLKRQKEDFDKAMADYVRLFTPYGGCGEYTKAACSMLTTVRDLTLGQNRLSASVAAKDIADEDKDLFNYYFASVTNKYHKVVDSLDVEGFAKELSDLEATGMTRTKGRIDNILSTSSPDKYVADLRYRVYEALMKQLCGAAIVLSDDLLSLPRLCPQAVTTSDVSKFGDITKKLLKATTDMGYSPAYVQLFTPYSDYADISVEKTTDLEGIGKGCVTEVLAMAVNYGTQKAKTQVSANM